MNAHARTFEDKPAVRQQVPLLIGLMGPSGGGKTFSALRLATGIQQASGGDIFLIDTEARRSLHYADKFKFRHLEFGAPFGSLDYLAAIRHCVAKGGGTVIVDSMSHEHEGPGGLLDFHDQELTRMAGDDYAKRERVKMLAWAKPKASRRQLINGLLQMNANFIFCFRAKETAKPVKKNGKTEVESQGFMPIAGDEFVFEMTVNCLLLPRANGVPTWQTDQPGERIMMKLPNQFVPLFERPEPLSEALGAKLAEWAKGGASTKTPAEIDKTVDVAALIELGESASLGGMSVLETWWKGLIPAEQKALKDKLADLKTKAGKADEEAAAREDQPADTLV